MSDQSKSSQPTTFKAQPNSTPSPVSVCGPTHCGSPGGQMVLPSGLGRAHVSHSVALAKGEGSRMIGTCGQCGGTLSPSADLQRSLGSKLRAQLEGTGSPLYVLTWKHWDMQSGPPICALRASGHRMSGSGSFSGRGWPTPTASLADKGVRSQDGGVREAMRSRGADLAAMATLAGWGTPTANEPGGTPEQAVARKKKAQAAGKQLGASVTYLAHQVQMVGWATPLASDSKGVAYSYGGGDKTKKCLRLLGQARTTSSVATANRGRLNPAFTRWLMGLPPEWGGSAPTATRLSRK